MACLLLVVVCVIAALRVGCLVWFVSIDFMLVVVCSSCWFLVLATGFCLGSVCLSC